MNSENFRYFDLSKEFRFETAHRLVKGYQGKCSNLHGHSWNGSITIRCTKLDEQGMGIDFGIIKEKVTRFIEATFDHATVLYKEDPLVHQLKKLGSKVVTVDDNPTSEVLANWIFDFASKEIDHIKWASVYQVEIKETCTSSCKVTRKSQSKNPYGDEVRH